MVSKNSARSDQIRAQLFKWAQNSLFDLVRFLTDWTVNQSKKQTYWKWQQRYHQTRQVSYFTFNPTSKEELLMHPQLFSFLIYENIQVCIHYV